MFVLVCILLKRLFATFVQLVTFTNNLVNVIAIDCRSRVLQQSAGVGEAGSIVWELALLLLFAWVLVYLCLWKGIKLTGKV